jgi:hypothetical protein
MLAFIQSQFMFYIAVALVLFIPGYFLILATRLYKEFSWLELFVIIFGSSVVVVDFLVILLGKTPLRITSASVWGAIILFSAACYAIYFLRNKKYGPVPAQEKNSDELPHKSAFLVILLIFLTIFIKTIYFKDTIFPTTTDLGHHMYWSKTIAVTGNLPQYEKADIGSQLTIEKPEPIADFIIGEHLIFAAIALISGNEFISAFPALVLFLIQIMSVLAIFILARSVFKKAGKYGDAIAIIALFLIGPLFALASPQAKFVSGGVIGNTLGNLFIPLSILFYIKAFAEKKSQMLAWALFISLGLAYTHHLSMFVFIFVAFFTVVAFAALNFRTIIPEAKEWLRLFISPAVIAVLVFGIIFVFFIYMPTYLNSSAINTAVGAPSKASRAGLTLTQLKTTTGEARFVFAIAGFILLFFARKIGKYRQAFMLGWLGGLILMSLRPDWLFVDIPSSRIASYIVFPVAIVAASMLVHVFLFFKDRRSQSGKNYLSPIFALVIFFAFMAFIATGGFYDDAQALNTSSSTNKAIQTYAASEYLAAHSTAQDMVLKDHNYLSGDTWIKLFFMRGYNYPLSRGYFKRYEDSATREQCTNLMISTPSSQEAQQCFAGTQTDFIMLNPKIDSAQFNRLRNFWQIYSSDEVGIFYKSN